MKKIIESSLRLTDSPITGAILATNRRFYGLTQAQAAALIHVSTKAWSQYEQQRRQISAGLYELFLIKAAQLDK